MNKKKLLLIGGLSLGLLSLAGCENAADTVNKAASEVEEAIEVEATKNNEFVLSVKNGTLNSYPDQMIEEAFENFFSSPSWKYFKGDTGEEVVEFTGYCTYQEVKVKAKLQFIVDETTNNFEIGALSFNDVPQDELTKFALIEAIYEDTEAIDPDPNLGHNDAYFIEEAQLGYIDVFPTETIGNIFNGMLFTNTTWSVNEYAEIIVAGDYNGEIVPGEPSYVQFTLAEVMPGEYTIIELQYNGQTVPEENHNVITDMILYATS